MYLHSLLPHKATPYQQYVFFHLTILKRRYRVLKLEDIILKSDIKSSKSFDDKLEST